MSARPAPPSSTPVERRSRGPSNAVLAFAAAAVFIVTWLLRYPDPGNELGGLIDDHFFYAVPGWQLLFGELPDRDFVDPGAPLTFVISAALQQLLGRSIWSEFIFCVTALSAGAALTCVLAARASGSVILGVLAALLETALLPRLYNYPKIAIYSVAIAMLWAWANRPRTSRTWWVAVLAAVAFLLRHDHGVYVAVAFAALLCTMRDFPWSARLRHAVIFGVATLVLLAPYLVYLQVNGGVLRHFVPAYRWSARDYDRAPLVLPELTWTSVVHEEPNDAPASEWWNHAPFPALTEYYFTWWIYWLMMALPPLALLLVMVRPGTGPPDWPQERAKIVAVAVLGLILDLRFLRGNLAGRFADASVPFAILSAWSLSTTLVLVRSGQMWVGSRPPRALPLFARVAAAAITLLVVAITALVLVRPARELLENSRMLEGSAALTGRLRDVTQRLQSTWPLPPDFADGKSGAVQLAMYLQECTRPTDRVLVTPMLPQTLGLANRAFAGGHLDLRAGFHDTVEEQQLTLERLRRQSVPVVIGPPSRELRDYRESLPLIAEYLSREYVNIGDKELRDGLTVSLLTKRDVPPVRTYEALELPCFR
jgi:hypothetical protein